MRTLTATSIRSWSVKRYRAPGSLVRAHAASQLHDTIILASTPGQLPRKCSQYEQLRASSYIPRLTDMLTLSCIVCSLALRTWVLKKMVARSWYWWLAGQAKFTKLPLWELSMRGHASATPVGQGCCDKNRQHTRQHISTDGCSSMRMHSSEDHTAAMVDLRGGAML